MGDRRYDLAMRLIREAAGLLPLGEKAEIPFQTKHGHQDIVSQFDKRIEAFLTQRIAESFPSDGVIGEESGAAGCGEWNWFIDPIDGTSNFVNQRKNFAISIACYHGDAPQFGLVLDAAADKLYHAKSGEGAFCNGDLLPRRPLRRDVSELFLYTPIVQLAFLAEHPQSAGLMRLANDVRAIRSLGSVALEICALASGEADLFLTARSSPWDHNAARIILAQVGGDIRTWENFPVPTARDCSVIAATSPVLLDEVMHKYFAG